MYQIATIWQWSNAYKHLKTIFFYIPYPYSNIKFKEKQTSPHTHLPKNFFNFRLTMCHLFTYITSTLRARKQTYHRRSLFSGDLPNRYATRSVMSLLHRERRIWQEKPRRKSLYCGEAFICSNDVLTVQLKLFPTAFAQYAMTTDWWDMYIAFLVTLPCVVLLRKWKIVNLLASIVNVLSQKEASWCALIAAVTLHVQMEDWNQLRLTHYTWILKFSFI